MKPTDRQSFTPRPVRLIFFGLLAALAVLLVGNARADGAADEFKEANRAYAEKNYDEAITTYQRLGQAYGYDGPVLYNLGNAYFQTDQLGKAILSYERALLLMPNDPDVLANLAVAREKAGLETDPPQWWQRVLDSLSPNQWAWLASSLLFLMAVVALLYWFTPGPIAVKWWRLALFLLLIGVGLTASFAGMAAMQRHYAVVTAKDAVVLQSPFAKAKQVARLPEGERVAVDKIDKKYQQYVRIRYDRRQLGWVSREQVEAVQPGLWTSTPENP